MNDQVTSHGLVQATEWTVPSLLAFARCLIEAGATWDVVESAAMMVPATKLERPAVAGAISVQKILEEQATANNVAVEAITGPCRGSHLVRVRDATICRLRDELGLSFPQIGGALNRDHSTIITAYRRAKARGVLGQEGAQHADL